MPKHFDASKVVSIDCTLNPPTFTVTFEGKVGGQSGNQTIDFADDGSDTSLEVVHHILGALSAAYGKTRTVAFTLDDNDQITPPPNTRAVAVKPPAKGEGTETVVEKKVEIKETLTVKTTKKTGPMK